MKDKRTKILTTTRSLLVKHGFHGFSMKQLAQEASVAAGTVYLYFKDKEDLIKQLHSAMLSEFAEKIFAEHDPGVGLFQQYQKLWKNFWYCCLAQPEVVLCKDQFDSLPAEVRIAHHKEALMLFSPLTAFFQQGRDSGELKSLSDEVLSTLSIESCSRLARKQILGKINLTNKDLDSVIAASWDAIACNQIINKAK